MQETAAGSAHSAHLPQPGEPPLAPYQQGGISYDAYYRTPDSARAEQLAKALGWLSIGVGLAQLLAPARVSQAIGIAPRPKLMRVLGARELAAGVGILSQRRPANWLWSRVAGDAMDLALLGSAARSQHARRRRITLATAAVAGVAVLDLLSSMDNQQRKLHGQGPGIGGEVRIEKAITVNRPPHDCYRMWHDFEAFPRFMKHLESVQLTGANRMHWVAKGPAGSSVEWDAEVIADDPNEYIAWCSLEGSEVDHQGTVRFEHAAGGRGTVVRVMLSYRPPGGVAGVLTAMLFGEEPAMQLDEDLRRFKWLIETGEIPTTVGQPSGSRGIWNRLVLRKGAPG
jgi:uncharacterized membrane protein